MSQIATSSSDRDAAISRTLGRYIVQTTDGLYDVAFWRDGSNLYYAVSADHGRNWGTPVSIASDATASRIVAVIDGSNNIYISNVTVSGANNNIRHKKMTYSGAGIWTQGSWQSAYTGNNASRHDMCVSGSTRIWIVVQEFNYTSMVWGDLKEIHSDDDGATWSSATTLKTSGGNAFIGYNPMLVVRSGNPVVVYGSQNGSDSAIGVREWNGSSWASEVTSAAIGGTFYGSAPVVIGSTVYIVYPYLNFSHNDGVDNIFYGDISVRTWNGSSIGSEVKLFVRQTIQSSYGLQAGTDGTTITIVMSGTPNRRGVVPLKFILYDPGTGKNSNQFVIDSALSSGSNEISEPKIAQKFQGYAHVVYAKNISGTKILSRYFSRDYGIKIAKAGHDVNEPLTEANRKNFIIMNTVDAHKIVYAGFVTSGSYTHGLGFPPFCDAFETDSTSSPTYFRKFNPLVSSTTISGIPNPSYIVVYREEM